MKVNTKRAAITGGLVWGGCIFVTTICNVYTGYAQGFLSAIAGIYPGYSLTLPGSIVGAIYGFFDMFVGVYIVMWVYKRLGK